MGLDIWFSRKKSKEIGYFRKVNFLVRYFADLGFDVSEQTPFEISREDAEILLSRCNEILKDHSKAALLLPTMSGFFFGSTEYDSDYFHSVLEVRDYVQEKLIPQLDDLKDDETIYFETSW